MSLIKNAIDAIRANEKRTSQQMVESHVHQETVFADTMIRLIDKLVDTIEERLTKYEEYEWLPIYECGKVHYLSAGKGIYVTDGVWAQVLIVGDEVAIQILDGIKLADLLGQRCSVGLVYSNGRIAAEKITNYVECLKDRGVKALRIRMDGFYYGTVDSIEF